MKLWILTGILALVFAGYLALAASGILWVVWNIIVGELFNIYWIQFYKLFICCFIPSYAISWLEVKKIIMD